MVSSADFVTDSIQVSGYAASEELVPARILRFAISNWDDEYDAAPVSVPLPPAAPSEVPAVILTSSNGSRRLEVARARANVLRLRTEAETALNIEQVLPELGRQLARLFEHDGTPLGRLAAVVHRTAQVQDPALTIARQYFRDRWLAAPLNRPEDLELHAFKVFDLREGLPVNSWVRIRTARRVEGDVPVILFEQDINTLRADILNQNFESEEVDRFYEAVARELSIILDLYFPPAENAEEA